MSKKYTERELAYEWTGESREIVSLKSTAGWGKEVNDYSLEDSIYDTVDQRLALLSTGVRARTKDQETTLTAKKFIGRGSNDEGLFEESHVQQKNHEHPQTISTSLFGIDLPKLTLNRTISIANTRREITFSKDKSLVRIINEDVTYINRYSTYNEPLLEVEFENVSDELITQVRQELEQNHSVKLIHEGKVDRANRYLSKSTMHVENIESIEPVIISAHGGKGNIQMRFFHTAFSRFDKANDPKVTDYQASNWDFFAHAKLPVGSEVKEHLHEKTDEIYFIIKGSAKFTVDSESRIVGPGDCILTRKNSRHSLTEVTEDLEFIATEIL